MATITMDKVKSAIRCGFDIKYYNRLGTMSTVEIRGNTTAKIVVQTAVGMEDVAEDAASGRL